MIEDVMLFGLGFCCATLVALLLLPAVWARAKRLVRRQLEMLLPLSLQEIEAERDGVRARAAVAQAQVEQRFERVREAGARAAVEAGRQLVAIAAAEKARDEVRTDRDTVQADLLRAREASAALQARFDDLTAESALSVEQLRQLQAKQADRAVLDETFGTTLQSRDTTITALTGSTLSLEAQVTELQATLDRTRGEQADLRVSLADQARERDTARAELLVVSAERASLQKQLMDEARRSEEYSARWLIKAEALANAERRAVEQTAELKAAEAAMSELKQRFEALEARLISTGAGNANASPVPADELNDLRTAIIDVADDAIRVLGAPAVPERLLNDRRIQSAGALF